MIERLESAGLGYHVTAEQSYEKFGEYRITFFVNYGQFVCNKALHLKKNL